MHASVDCRPLPRFIAATSLDGSILVSWPPLQTEATDAVILIALRSLSEELAVDFWSGALDADLIRVPIPKGSQQVRVCVPRKRPVHIAIHIRDHEGRALEAPEIDVRVDETRGESKLPEAPIAHEASGGRDIPLVFAGEDSPDLAQLASSLR
ncbi:MAG: hypothetical protein VX938_11025, partial [Myxococcota bacterium]|nr:hypothetical protein [Myxococcota bacterium]